VAGGVVTVKHRILGMLTSGISYFAKKFYDYVTRNSKSSRQRNLENRRDDLQRAMRDLLGMEYLEMNYLDARDRIPHLSAEIGEV